jgi:hypothetical protein
LSGASKSSLEAPSSAAPSLAPPAVTFTKGDAVLIHGLTSSKTELNGRVGVFINHNPTTNDCNIIVNTNGTYKVSAIPPANLKQVVDDKESKVTVPIPVGGLKPELGVGGIASMKSNNTKVNIVSFHETSDLYGCITKTKTTGMYIDKSDLTPIYSPFEVKYSNKSVVDLLAGGRGSVRIRCTRKYQNQKRHPRGNMRRRITRKVKRSRRVGLIHRGGGGRGGKIYRKTRKHVRGGRGGRGHGGHRRTIKKYHRR